MLESIIGFNIDKKNSKGHKDVRRKREVEKGREEKRKQGWALKKEVYVE